MTALMAPSRGGSFEGIVFFVYDREAVKKEADPPENAIIYFYPPSASIEERISICGQLIGMSHFMQSFIGARPALFKLETEKMATRNSGKYTLALGGGLSEPDSLLIRQLETLHSIFTFYHGSLDRMRMMCDSQRSFLLLMNVIWDCYLPFVRHYGDFLPGVFDPLPFLDLPKSVAATCFTKASYILQACQRRQHVLGGCILYSNSILCTQLEPSITERLLLLKPNQSNHPARPVKTECDLPFGVRILNAFLTLSEYLNLYEALAQSPYQKPGSAEGDGTFPDLYTLPTTSSATGQDSVSMQSDESVGKRLDDSKAQESNANSEVSSSGEELGSSVSKQSCSLVNSEASLESSTSFPECSTVNSAASVESSISYPEGCDCAEISPAERKGVEKEFDDEGYSTTQEVVLTSSVTESSSNDSPTMDAIDITGLKVVKCCFDNFPKRSSSGDWENKNVSTPSKAPSYLNKKRAICSNCREADTCTDDATRICALVMEDLIKHVEQAAEEEKASRDEKLPAGVSSTLPHCQSCTVAVEANLVPRIETKGPWERGCEEGPRLADTPCLSDNEASLLEQKAAATEPANSKTVDECLETTSMAPPTDSQETRSSFGCDGEELNCRRQTNTTVVTDSGDTTDVTSNEAIHLRTDVLKTPIVCDSFSSRNLNIGVEKTLEKSFPFSNSSSDFASESETLSSRSQNSSDDVITEGVASGDEFDASPVHTALEGAGAQVDAAQEETEDSSSRHESLLDSGRTSPSSISREEEEVVFNEEEEHGTNQVEGLTHVNLYVQAHSQVVLILLAEDMLYKDFNSIKALWDTSLNELGELEFLVKQSLDNPPKPAHTDEYSFLVYDSFERNMQGSLGEPVFKLDHSFCETTKVMYEQFDNCPSLKDITLRSRSSTVYGKRNLGRGTYFHLKGSYRAVQGVPSPRDPAWTLEKRASKLLHKEHGVNVF